LTKIIIYSYSKCSTCRKALKWLNQKGLEYQLIEIIKNPPLTKYLKLALKQYSSEKRKVFNTRGQSFKSINSEIFNASIEEISEILHNDGKLIKRPFLIYKEKKILLGFNETEYENYII